ncbi:MAG: NAD(P)/FAD-dependent oxidoreductase [Chloroflexi bacterium]|nr:NAD(P)/FAD-dependent oxidoreductase [Chloroflexota bacterium]
MTRTRIVIVGNGIAGVTAAKTIREISADASITLVSEEKTPVYSAPVLAYYLSGDIPRSRIFIRKPEDYERDGIETRLGQRVNGLDCQAGKVFLDRATLEYDALVLATGSTPSPLPVKGVGLRGVFAFKSLADIDAIAAHRPQRVVVAGAGPVGLEAATALKKTGAGVTVVATRWVAPRAFDEKAAGLLQKALEDNGVLVINHERVLSIEGAASVEGVVTESRSLECDTVIVAAGMTPAVGLAKSAGIRVGELGGIAVDNAMSSSIRGVYACGDCVETTDALSGKKALNLLWSNARQQARVAARNCLGGKEKYHGSVNARALTIFGVAASSFGYSASVLDGKGVDIMENQTRTSYCRLVFHRGELVGGQWVGPIRDTGPLMAAVRNHGGAGRAADLARHGMSGFVNPVWPAVSGKVHRVYKV